MSGTRDDRAAGAAPAAARAHGLRAHATDRLVRITLLALPVACIGFASLVPLRAEAVPPAPTGTVTAGESDTATPALEADAECPPFEAAAEPSRLASLDEATGEPGVEPARPDELRLPADASDAARASRGQIVTLPRATPATPSTSRAAEAILALPRGAPRDFDLGPGARVVESYWSAVLCATVARVSGPPGASPRELVTKAPATAAVVANPVYATAAEPEVVLLESDPGAKPDPYRPLQWGLDRSGVEEARALSRGTGVVVALLDSLPEVDHADLGPIEVVPVEGGPDAGAPGAHGTLMAGVVGAIEGNGFGIAGLAPAVRLVAVPVCTPRGASAQDACPLFTVLRGVDAAWSAEVAVVNLSIVGPDNTLLRRSMDRLDELGVLVVAAAGNGGTEDPRFPAAYPSVIGVGGLDREGRRAARSNRGVSAEILAPGVEILSTAPGKAFAFASGTSFAASHVTGSLAILLGAGLDPIAARQALFQTAASAPVRPGQAPALPRVCDALARAGRPCPGASAAPARP